MMHGLIYITAILGLSKAHPLLFQNTVELDSDENQESGKHGQTNCPCGWSNKVRIVGGKETMKNEYPLVASIITLPDMSVFSGATIITAYHALTAAHSVDVLRTDPLGLLVGHHNIEDAKSKSENTSEIIPIKKTIVHENYETNFHHNDIALLILTRPITFTQYVGPACMPTHQQNLVNEEVKIIGWGKTSNRKKTLDKGSVLVGEWDSQTTSVLMEADFKVIDNSVCDRAYIKEIPDNPRIQICTLTKKKDICDGDSGGPVIWLDPMINRFTVVGIVSYSTQQCKGNKPNVNTDVAYYIPWITEKIAESEKPGVMCMHVK